MKRFADAYPGIRLKLHNVTGRDGLAMLRAGEADLAVGSMLDMPWITLPIRLTCPLFV